MTEASETDFLYHYTTQDGLLGILENNCLWATYYKFLNDYSEIDLFKNELVKLIEPDVRESLKKAYSHTLKETKPFTEEQKIAHANSAAEIHCYKRTNEIINRLYEHIANHYEIYITSLCESHSKVIKSLNNNDLLFSYGSDDDDDGLLSLWRAYGGDGGYAIEFARTEIKKLIKEEEKRFGNYTIIFDDVMYSNDEAEYKKHFPEQLETIKTYIKDVIVSNCSESDKTNVYVALICCTAFYKHCGFKEERESRIVALPSIPLLKFLVESAYMDDKPRKFRNKNSKKNSEQVPYIELFDKNKKDKNGKKDISENTPLPIKKIIVGPHKDKEARAAWLRIKLDSISRDDIEVTVSQIPFVGR